MHKLRHFRFWCQKVLPLVYDDSLSYYEVLCKVVHYINNLIKTQNEMIDELDELKEDLEKVQEWIDNFDVSMIEKFLRELIPTFVTFGLTQSGYFVVYIPGAWETVNFKTTGLDIVLELEPEFGHLVLEY